MATPDFIIAGAAKCGTTALWYFLDEHPQIGMSFIKEPRFFTEAKGGLVIGVEDAEIPRSGTFHRGLDWYQDLWRDAPEGAVLGEATTIYFVAPDAPRLIHEHNPDARIILMVRDPVHRLYSHYWHELKAGWDAGDFREEMETDSARWRYMESTSHYRTHIEHFLETFDRDQILLLVKEDLDTNPEVVLEEVFRFVGVDASFRPPTLGKRYNTQRMPRFPWLRRFSERARETVGDVLPESLRQFLGRTQRKIEKRLSVPLDYPPMAPDLRARLMERFEDDIRYVEEWTGTPRPEWRTLDAAPTVEADS